MSVKEEGLDGVLQDLSWFERRIVDRLPAAAAAAVGVLRPEVERRAPRLTGRLAAGIEDEPGETTATSAQHCLVIGVFYGKYVEYGTRKMRAQPFIRPSIDSKNRAMREAIKQVIFAT